MAAYGETMLAVQQFEEAMVGLLGASAEIEAVNTADIENLMERLGETQERWEPLFSKPAGWLARLLGYDDPADDVRLAVDARNLLAHHYLRDHTQQLAYEDGRREMLDRLHVATERFRAFGADFDRERSARMSAADLTEDHITTPREAREMRHWDPDLDDTVPPEPFDA